MQEGGCTGAHAPCCRGGLDDASLHVYNSIRLYDSLCLLPLPCAAWYERVAALLPAHRGLACLADAGLRLLAGITSVGPSLLASHERFHTWEEVCGGRRGERFTPWVCITSTWEVRPA